MNSPPYIQREVILGRSAKIWKQLSARSVISERFEHAIGHAALPTFSFCATDRVWVFAYSRHEDDNTRMLQHLAKAGVAEIVYISSSSTIISSYTDCYEYPRAKKRAESHVESLPNGKVLTLGLVVENEEELPAGTNVATTIDELAAFMLAPIWALDGCKHTNLLHLVRRPFRSKPEQILYHIYSGLISTMPRKPCLLRPLDMLLRIIGMRWYGYTFLSNRLWTRLMT